MSAQGQPGIAEVPPETRLQLGPPAVLVPCVVPARETNYYSYDEQQTQNSYRTTVAAFDWLSPALGGLGGLVSVAGFAQTFDYGWFLVLACSPLICRVVWLVCPLISRIGGSAAGLPSSATPFVAIIASARRWVITGPWRLPVLSPSQLP